MVWGLGYADFSSSSSIDQALVVFELHAEPFYENGRFELGLAGSVAADSTGDLFVGAGLAGLYALDRRWFIEASVLPGYFRASDPENSLGSDFEIRSLLGIGYTLGSGSSLSLAIAHISNASTSSVNPGANGIQLRWRRRF